MRRRQVLTAAALSTVSLAGCRSPTSDPDDPILFVLSNETGSQQTVSITLTRTDQTYVDETVTLGPGDSREYDSDIRSPGDYELVVTVQNGPERTLTLSIEAYDVRMGSNHDVVVKPDEIDVFWEE